MNLKSTGRIFAMLISTLAITGSVIAAEPMDPTAGQWTEQKANDWSEKQPWLFGFNFVPSTAVNDTAMWQKEIFDPHNRSRACLGGAAWATIPAEFLCNILSGKQTPKASRSALLNFLILQKSTKSRNAVLFDDCAFDANRDPYLGKQDDPVPGASNARWVPSPGLKLVTDKSAWPDLEKYIKDMVGAFKNDKRIVLWDLYNEPGNSKMGNKRLPLVEATFAWAHQAKPSQPLTHLPMP